MKLRYHLLQRLHPQRLDYSLPFTPIELSELQIVHDKVYWHPRLTVHFTTYDMKRAKDVIQVDTNRCDAMVCQDEEGRQGAPRFYYARVLKIGHVNVRHPDLARGDVSRINFLFVRWFTQDTSYKSGWKHRRLDRVSFREYDDEAFGFLDPATVTRACHLIPAFNLGGKMDQLPTASDLVTSGRDEYASYYVNR